MEPEISAPPPLPTPAQPSTPARKLAVWPIVRDVLIVFFLTAAGGFVVGVASAAGLIAAQYYMVWIGASNLVLGTVAFAICGVRAGEPRWGHLALVMVGSWVVSLVNVLFMGVTVAQWAAGIFVLALMMGIGGAISFAIRPSRR